MRNWEKKRTEEISEHVLVTHIVCLLIFLLILFIYFDLPYFLDRPLLPLNERVATISILMVAFCLFTVLYISRYLLSKINILSQARIEEILLLIIIFPSTFAFIWFSGGFLAAKVLIIIPVIIAVTAFGKKNWIGSSTIGQCTYVCYRFSNIFFLAKGCFSGKPCCFLCCFHFGLVSRRAFGG